MNRIKQTNEIIALMQKYENGIRERNVDALKEQFHPNASMSGFLGGELLVGTPVPFFDFVANNEVAPEYEFTIAAVNVNYSFAMVRILEDNLFGMSFITEMHLIKIGSEWKIVNKIFHHN